MLMGMNGRTLLHNDKKSSYQVSDVFVSTPETGIKNINWTNHCHCLTNNMLWFGITMNQHFMLMISVNLDGST